jgi:hypothetical protein
MIFNLTKNNKQKDSIYCFLFTKAFIITINNINNVNHKITLLKW